MALLHEALFTLREKSIRILKHSFAQGLLVPLSSLLTSNVSTMSRESFFFRNCDAPTLIPAPGTLKKEHTLNDSLENLFMDGLGEIPVWLTGTLTRNGPGINKVGNETYKHLFDGMAIIHRFHIQDGKVTYNSRPLESDTYRINMANQRIVVGEFGTVGIGDPCNTLFSKFKSLFVKREKSEHDPVTTTDNCSVNVGYYGDQLYAMTETSLVRRIDPVTLEVIGEKTNIAEYIAINLASAHPHILEDGTALNLGINFRHAKGISYLIIQVPPTFGETETNFKNVKIIAEIPCRWKLHSAYYHSFGITKDKIVFMEQPFCIKLPKMLISGIFRTSFRDALSWYAKEKTRFYIVCMKTGVVHPVVYETDNLFAFHHANAYEEDGQMVVDLVGYDSAEWVSKDIDAGTVQKENTSAYNGASARRYILPLDVSVNSEKLKLENKSATATLRKGSLNIVDLTPETLVDGWLEFPRINYKYNGLKYNYLYACMSSQRKKGDAIPEPDTLVKVNVETKEKVVWVEKGVWVSEPVFVQNPTIADPKEDDGVVLANILYAEDSNKTTLLILDARTMTEVAKVDFETQGPVNATFHGQWSNTHDQIHGY